MGGGGGWWWWVYRAKTNTALVQLLDGGLPELVNNKYNAMSDSPRIYLSVSKPREVRKVVMKALWRNVAFWRRLVVPRLVITPPYISSDFNVQIYYSNWQSSQIL